MRAVLFFFAFFTAGGAVATAPLCSESFYSGLDVQLERSVVDLADKQEIPQTIYDQFSTQDIGKAIVSRVRKQEIEFKDMYNDETQNKKIDFRNETDIILFFWSQNIDSIRQSGFLNQHELGASKGELNPGGRKVVEDHYVGLQMGYGSQAKTLRPKSAFLNIRAAIDLVKKTHEMTTQYGDIGAVFKSDLKDRALWSTDDSLGIGMKKLAAPGGDLVSWRGTFDRGSIPLNNMYGSYYEALVYGRLTFDDVDYFLVVDPAAVEGLKPLGKPIYAAKRTFRNNRVVFEKGVLLFGGDEPL